MADTPDFKPADRDMDGVVTPAELKKFKASGSYDSWNPERTAAEYSFGAALIQQSPELTQFFKRISDIIQRTGKSPTKEQFTKLANQNAWFKQHDSNQQEALIQMSNPATRLDYERSVQLQSDTIAEYAGQLGVNLDTETLADMAKTARLNKWGPQQIKDSLRPLMEVSLNQSGNDLTGSAGDVQTQLSQWAKDNGLDIPDKTMSRLVANGAFGKQGIDDMKAELRKTYLMGAYPAWSDRIAAGADPSDLVAPYRGAAAKLLEMDDADVSFSDPLIKQAMQNVGPDGKPRVVPLYEFEQMVRKDSRWQKTDNAYSTYTGVAQNLLQMFGFR